MSTLNQQKINELKELDDDGSNETLIELINLYLRTTPIILKKLLEDFNLGKVENVKRSAHSLRSSSLNLGVDFLAETMRKIEYLEDGPDSLENLRIFIGHANTEFLDASKLLKELV